VGSSQEFPGLPFREVIIGSYHFFYRIKDQTCGSLPSGMAPSCLMNQCKTSCAFPVLSCITQRRPA